MRMDTSHFTMICHNSLVIAAMAAVAFSCSPSDKKTVKVSEQAYALLEQVAEKNAGGNKQTAVTLADSALSMAPADTTRCWLLCEKTVALTDMGKMKEAIATGKEALALAKSNGDVDAQLNMRGALGVAYRRSGETDSALTEYKKGIELAVREKNSEYEIYLANCAAVLFSDNNRFAEALEYSRKAEKAAFEAGDTVEWLSARANIGGVYLRQRRYKDVVRVMTPLWKDVMHTDYNVLTLKYLSALIKAHSELGDDKVLASYMKYADRAMQGVSVTSNGVLGILEIKTAMLGKQKLYGQQLALLDSMAVANKKNRIMPEDRLLSERAVCLWNLNRKEEAYAVLTKAYRQLDSVKKSDVENSMSDFAVKYKTLEKEMKIEQMSHRETVQHNRILWLAVAVAVLGAAVCVILFRKRMAAQRAELSRRRSYISGLENERARLAKELHDGVCNDILAVTLLMKTDKAGAERQLRDVWRDARGLSHALMPPQFSHASLPETVEAYIKAVSDDENTKVNLCISGVDKWRGLSQETSYELYRIIQESVSNALKYGNGNDISVSLNAVGNALTICIENGYDKEAEDRQDRGIGMETIKMRASGIGATVSSECSEGKYKVEVKLG